MATFRFISAWQNSTDPGTGGAANIQNNYKIGDTFDSITFGVQQAQGNGYVFTGAYKYVVHPNGSKIPLETVMSGVPMSSPIVLVSGTIPNTATVVTENIIKGHHFAVGALIGGFVVLIVLGLTGKI